MKQILSGLAFLFCVHLLNAQPGPFGYQPERKRSHFYLRGPVKQVSQIADTTNYNASGSGVLKFDQRGFLTQRTRWRYEGQQLPAIEVYSYYSNDSLKSCLETYDGRKTGMRQYHYSPDMRNRKEYFYYGGVDHLVDSALFNEYGEVVSKYHFNRGFVTEHRDFYYDAEGRLVQWLKFDDSGYIVLQHHYQYDSDNNLIEDIQLGYLNEFEGRTCFLYQSGKLASIVSENNRSRKSVFYEYDSLENLIREITFWNEEPFYSRLVEYTVDPHGNWITQKFTYNDGEKVNQYYCLRKIEYYEGD